MYSSSARAFLLAEFLYVLPTKVREISDRSIASRVIQVGTNMFLGHEYVKKKVGVQHIPDSCLLTSCSGENGGKMKNREISANTVALIMDIAC